MSLCERLAYLGKHAAGREETKHGLVLIAGFEGVILCKA